MVELKIARNEEELKERERERERIFVVAFGEKSNLTLFVQSGEIGETRVFVGKHFSNVTILPLFRITYSFTPSVPLPPSSLSFKKIIFFILQF